MKRLIALLALTFLLAGCLPLVPPPPGGGHGGHYRGEYGEHHGHRY